MGGKGSGGAHNPKGNPKAVQMLKDSHDPTKVDPDTNSRVIALNKWLFGLESPDYGDESAVKARFFDYLDMCDSLGLKPMVMTAARALGMTRQEFYGISHGLPNYRNWHGGCLTPESIVVVTKAHELLSGIWEGYITEEKGNPVKWIFLGKNYFGMRDVSEHVQVRADVTPQLTSPDELQSKYSKMVGKPQQSLTEGVIESIEDVPES